ncbi:YHS domain-containing (seleno)protein [Alteromonas sp. ASW11-36]|uniref:YHS domain-containing (Seleno)protein n=1 Tax=Alteromonas arenosi TaxID=3055817 RepID=A0ABT7SSS5_9ALTE|nr:YHS domain-containing (seleno)protein [Alteromonas sp. ASW11-36]MDM7859206.1 YHS domain-containing (seleno)protein [Alteromonas sp. ASW11-36]
MKQLSLLLRGFVLFLIFAAANAHADDPIETGTFNNKAIYGYDTVAYFTMGEPVKGSDKYMTTWRGAEWYFSSQEHLDMFTHEPEKFAPQYGGYCAYAMSDGRLVGIDEEAFTILDGKLYLNYSKSVMREWRANTGQFIEEANAWYPKLVDLPAGE